jgi:hypothetical protein
LLGHEHLDIAVHVDTANPRVIEAVSKALDWWSRQLEMSWRFTVSATDCAIEFRPHAWLSKQLPGSINSWQEIGGARMPGSPLFDGVIFFLYPTMKYDLERCFAHEFGHVLGLAHNPDPDSIMFSNTDEAALMLTNRDARLLGRYHSLRRETK